MGDGYHVAQNFLDLIQPPFPGQRHGVADAGRVNDLALAQHFDQLPDHLLRQRGVSPVALNLDLLAPEGDHHIQFLLQGRHVPVVHAEQR